MKLLNCTFVFIYEKNIFTSKTSRNRIVSGICFFQTGENELHFYVCLLTLFLKLRFIRADKQIG